MRLLIVEDAASLCETLVRGFRKAGFRVDHAHDGEEAMDSILSFDYDGVILDLMLPKMDGMTVLREMRAQEMETPVLILTAKATVPERVAGLEAGADDYLVKPFAFEELLARVRVMIRHRYGEISETLEIGNLRFDTAARRVQADAVEVVLRPREFNLLEYLMRREGQVVSRHEILDHVYDHAVDLRSNAIDSSVSKLRKSLREAAAEVEIRTVPRRGYLFERT